MAEFNINITIPDEKVDDFLDALRTVYRPAIDAVDQSPLSTSELKERVKADLMSKLRRIYREHVRAAPPVLGDS